MSVVCGGGVVGWLPDDAPQRFCCYGDAMDGPRGCTCWEPIFDLEQQPIDREAVRLLAAGIEPVTRRARCADCAFRPDSPERARGDDPEDLPHFWCHQGIRCATAYRHPDGTVIELPSRYDYQPPIVNGVPYRADGTPAERCAGMAQHQRRLART